ncbi:DUF2064 domain-containing protein [Angustibacter peucedani]
MGPLTLLVLAKEPLPGRAKTRLEPAVGPDGAAALAAAALADTLDVVAATPAARRVLVLDGEPGPWLPPGFEVLPQVGGGLAERLAGAFAAVDGPAFLVGMDTPQLTPADLSVELRAGGPDAAIGMCEDGGFWGVGMLAPRPEVFLGVPMSQPTTGALQRVRLVEAGFDVLDLPVRRDVDEIEDARVVATSAPRTRFASTFARVTGVPPRRSPVELYDAALRGGPALRLVADDGRVLPWLLDRWSQDADDDDRALLDRCEGVTLDVGCGPGRMAAELAARGRPVLGVDIAGASVERTAAAGALALHRSVFDGLPGEGRWDTVLLVDGNLGIGGDPGRVLQRIRELLRPGGLLLVEPEPHDVDEVTSLQLRTADGDLVSEEFAWARVGPAAAVRRAERLGYRVEERWSRGGRQFVALRR